MPMLFWFPMILMCGVYGLVSQAPKTRQSGSQTQPDVFALRTR